MSPAGPGSQARRELAAAVLGCLAGGGLALVAAWRPWALRVTPRQPPLSPIRESFTGADLAGWAPGAALVALAAAIALYAARGWGRTAVAVITVLAGAAIAAGGIRGLAVAGDAGREVTAGGLWPVAVTIGGLLVLATGVLALRRGAAWPSMSARYQRADVAASAAPSAGAAAADGTTAPPARPPESESQDDPSAMWDALDAGADPTAER